MIPVDGDSDQQVTAEAALPPADTRKGPDWLARVGWAVLVVAVVLAGLAATVGWDTTASATVIRRCGQWIQADGETLYRGPMTVAGRTVPAGQAAAVPASEWPLGTVRLPSGAIRFPSSLEYPGFPSGSRVRVHHRLFRRNTFRFLPDHGAPIPIGTTAAVACTGGP